MGTQMRREREPVVAICYDFDRTLSPDDMQAQGYIQSVGYDVAQFWAATGELARDNQMDSNLAYMYKMMKEAEGNLVLTRDSLAEYGAKVKLFEGVEDWFERIREYGAEKGVKVEHYIISSGLKEMIEGTKIADAFEQIYASSFFYDESGVVKWPAQVVNYTNKTQFLFRISKGVLDINDAAVNDYFPLDEIRIPFKHMVYIGDSDTDIPCMKLINTYGGFSVGVFDPETGNKDKVVKMMREERIKYFAPADYRENTQMDMLVKSIIDCVAAECRLEEFYVNSRREAD